MEARRAHICGSLEGFYKCVMRAILLVTKCGITRASGGTLDDAQLVGESPRRILLKNCVLTSNGKPRLSFNAPSELTALDQNSSVCRVVVHNIPKQAVAFSSTFIVHRMKHRYFNTSVVRARGGGRLGSFQTTLESPSQVLKFDIFRKTVSMTSGIRKPRSRD